MSSSLRRVIELDAIIRSKRYPSIKFLTNHFEVSERTIHNDLDYLRNSHNAPIVHSRIHGGYYYSDPTWILPTIIATEGELLAFFLSAELARRYLGTSFEEPLRQAIDKVAAHLPDQHRIDLNDLAQHYTFQAGATASADPELLLALNRAMIHRNPIEMTYFTASRGERTYRTIEPYYFHNVRGDWQIVAFDRLRGQFRNFAVSRIEAWKVLESAHFVRDAGFSIGQYLASGFLAERGEQTEEIIVWFDAYQATYIRHRQWHASQCIEEHDDGSLTLRFATGALEEVRRWIMAYGSHAIARAPDTLISAIIEETRRSLQNYK